MKHTPHAFALTLLAQLCRSYRASSALVMVLFSGRLVRRGASIMTMVKSRRLDALAAASSNQNIAFDFGPTAKLSDDASHPCETIADLNNATVGLWNFARANWFPHGYLLASALRRFVTARMTGTQRHHDQCFAARLTTSTCGLGTRSNHSKVTRPTGGHSTGPPSEPSTTAPPNGYHNHCTSVDETGKTPTSIERYVCAATTSGGTTIVGPARLHELIIPVNRGDCSPKYNGPTGEVAWKCAVSNQIFRKSVRFTSFVPIPTAKNKCPLRNNKNIGVQAAGFR